MIQFPSQRFHDFCPAWGFSALEAFDAGRATRANIVVHRKGRKDTVALNLMIRECLRNPMRQYLYAGQTRVDIKQIVWTNPEMLFAYLPDQRDCPWVKNEQDLTITFPNRTVLYLRGGDDPDSWRGPDYWGAVLSEWSYMKPQCLDVIRPIFVQDPTRWYWLIYTPNGQNHGYDTYQEAEEHPDEWYSRRLTCYDTGVMAAEAIEHERQRCRPDLFDQEMMVSFITTEERALITSAMLDALRGVTSHHPAVRRVVSVDPAMGGDECVIYALNHGNVTDATYLRTRDSATIVLETVLMARRHATQSVVIDAIGIGDPISQTLRGMGLHVLAFKSSEQADEPERFANARAEAYWQAMERVRDKLVDYPSDLELRRQLSSTHYEMRSQGNLIMEPKAKVKKALGRSPDRADAWVMGQWATTRVVELGQRQKRDGYERRHRASAMTA